MRMLIAPKYADNYILYVERFSKGRVPELSTNNILAEAEKYNISYIVFWGKIIRVIFYYKQQVLPG